MLFSPILISNIFWNFIPERTIVQQQPQQIQIQRTQIAPQQQQGTTVTIQQNATGVQQQQVQQQVTRKGLSLSVSSN